MTSYATFIRHGVSISVSIVDVAFMHFIYGGFPYRSLARIFLI
jgi:hypothetical protein